MKFIKLRNLVNDKEIYINPETISVIHQMNGSGTIVRTIDIENYHVKETPEDIVKMCSETICGTDFGSDRSHTGVMYSKWDPEKRMIYIGDDPEYFNTSTTAGAK